MAVYSQAHTPAIHGANRSIEDGPRLARERDLVLLIEERAKETQEMTYAESTDYPTLYATTAWGQRRCHDGMRTRQVWRNRSLFAMTNHLQEHVPFSTIHTGELDCFELYKRRNGGYIAITSPVEYDELHESILQAGFRKVAPLHDDYRPSFSQKFRDFQAGKEWAMAHAKVVKRSPRRRETDRVAQPKSSATATPEREPNYE